MTPSPSRRVPAPLAAVGRLVVGLAIAAIALIAGIEVILLVLRPEDGLVGVIDILSPHLALAGLALTPIWLVRRTRRLAVVVALLVVVCALRFGGNWLSLPVTSAAGGEIDRIEVATWNLEVFSRSGSNSAAVLRATTADIVALQELQPNAATAIGNDPVLRERFPYRALSPRSDVLGLGIVSRYPIVEDTFDLWPAVQTARILVSPGQTVHVINAHPMHGDIETAAGLPIGIDVTKRDADLDTIRALIDRLGDDGLPVILLGDLNTADTEPAFGRFTHGLRDVHADVGSGPGWTWRPRRFEFLGIGLIRIDHVVVSPLVQPISIGQVCPPAGDHCLVHAGLALPARVAADGGSGFGLAAGER